jgi:hypothetical protein
LESLQKYFAQAGKTDISALGRYIERHVEENWLDAYENNEKEIEDLYNKIGDGAYGLYGQHLFKPIHEQLKEAGLRSRPKLPFGNFSISREWGPEDDRQRWFWSKISTEEGAPLGTIVVIFYHDHFKVRIPRPPGIIALEETAKENVINVLSALSPEFGEALEAKAEYALYLQQQEQ